MSNPTVFLNGYLSEMVPKYLQEYGTSDINYFDGGMRFFPVSPTAIDELTSQLPSATEAPFAVYDRMFRFRRSAFPHIKCEQMLYYFYKVNNSASNAINSPSALIETSQAVYDLLDRGDESAQEINAWIKSKLNSNGEYVVGSGMTSATFNPVYFHQTKVFQLEEIRDIIDFGTARTYAGNKIIIDYDYHNSVDFSVRIPFDGRDPANNPNDPEDFSLRLEYPDRSFLESDES